MQGLDFEKKSETREDSEGTGAEEKFTYTDAEKTKSVLKIDHECNNINSAWTFANDKVCGEVAGRLVDDDWKVNAGVAYESKAAKGEWRGCGLLNVEGDLGGIKAALNVSESASAVHSKHYSAYL